MTLNEKYLEYKIIQDCESIPCGGTHVEKLGEIKKIDFNRIEPTENGCKIFYDVK